MCFRQRFGEKTYGFFDVFFLEKLILFIILFLAYMKNISIPHDSLKNSVTWNACDRAYVHVEDKLESLTNYWNVQHQYGH